MFQIFSQTRIGSLKQTGITAILSLVILNAAHADHEKFRLEISVAQPLEESFAILTSSNEVSSVKRDTEVQTGGKTQEVGYHLQFRPHLNDATPYVILYVKSIIAALPGDLSTPGYITRTQSVKVLMTRTGNALTGSASVFTKNPIVLSLAVPKY